MKSQAIGDAVRDVSIPFGIAFALSVLVISHVAGPVSLANVLSRAANQMIEAVKTANAQAALRCGRHHQTIATGGASHEEVRLTR